jgi:hypothetical protein
MDGAQEVEDVAPLFCLGYHDGKLLMPVNPNTIHSARESNVRLHNHDRQ